MFQVLIVVWLIVLTFLVGILFKLALLAKDIMKDLIDACDRLEGLIENR